MRRNILSARERRQAQVETFSELFPCTLMLSLLIPGEEKCGERPSRLFHWGLVRLAQTLPVTLLYSGEDALGPYALFQAKLSPQRTKEEAVRLEPTGRCGQLLDIDVYDDTASPVGRSLLGLPPRRCLICGEPATQCMCAERHGQALLEEAYVIIDKL